MRTLFLVGTLALGLSACSVTVRPDTNANVQIQGRGSNLITGLRPDRGEGSTYGVGEAVSFAFSTRAPGYVTLIALQSNGFASVLTQNAYVNAGTTVFPRPEDGVMYNLGEPRGIQRVRAVFTRVRPTTSIVLSGNYDTARFNSTTTAYLDPYNQADRDVQETFLYIR
ncbi:DUF4384 domain-containing protein [Deinococcus arenicola]|uniref:DUF4384 domain-containing protein n=1 Tax=Deinococcus arenicola TaxID=2994950 RepID=A0ABU4DQ48_9DEIO|nr:DUF4384 domain-containing protein [Deinococcus sp. ZS9-10]MDV6374560.1 DUF4384 domain-containing protein [Deinococcus sp. ZS9-10]